MTELYAFCLVMMIGLFLLVPFVFIVLLCVLSGKDKGNSTTPPNKDIWGAAGELPPRSPNKNIWG